MLKKDITFIYTDSAEKSIWQPIAEEAKRRNYRVTLTDNQFSRCEIGFYCQHVNFPQFSKFSFIMLHDIIQQYANWPDIWFLEPWHKYDIGILPSNQWVKNWHDCSRWYYTRPRKGVFKVGWPKADIVVETINSSRENLVEKYKLDKHKRTILYAPAWENDNKQDDFVRSMQKLDVNILIKQCDVRAEKFPEMFDSIVKMRDLHSGLENVVVLPPSTNIFHAISISDVLVSEESSTMCEALMLGIPAVSVSDWLIPDVKPSRFPKHDYDFVIMTKKAELTNCVNEIIANYELFKRDAESFSANNFSNIGLSSKIIMDIVDDCVLDKKIRYEEIQPRANEFLSLKRFLSHKYNQIHREIYYNYSERFSLVRKIWALARRLKRGWANED